MRRMCWLSAIALIVGVSAAQADVKMHGICGEGMVLQQKTKAAVWGTAEKGEKVTVTFRGSEASTTADDNGNWLVKVAAGDAGGPFEMSIVGKNKIDYKNILVGEVWVCSGQSNMEWSVNACDESDKSFAKSAPHNANLRMYTVKRLPLAEPTTETSGTWTDADPKTVGSFSAVGYFFGRYLQKELNIPIGLIHTSWGGTRAEAWTSKEVLNGHPMFAHEHKSPQKNGNPNGASALYNGMINPIKNYTIKGAIWYQGESNAGQAWKYRTLFPLMIENWRKDWGIGDFPFYFVQLAPFTQVAKTPGESNWAELREAQLMTLKLPNTGMAVITDFGDEYDIHPTPKRPVGERLALIALAKDYGKKIEYSGPVYKDMKVEGSKVVLNFEHANGLTSKEMVVGKLNPNAKKEGAWRAKDKSDGAPLVGFTVAGEDKKFVPAKAEIIGNTVVVTAEGVEKPVAVRYGWANHPVVNLFNAEGLPATPFRTDTYPGITQPKQ
jgi:sialate O-acetylesterase